MGLLMKQAVSRIDGRTTVICLHAAGMIRELNEPFDTLNGSYDAPPFHTSCRTVLRPYMRGFISGQRKAANAELQRRPLKDRRFTGLGNYSKRLPPPKTRVRTSAEDLLREWNEWHQVNDVLGTNVERLTLVSGRKVIRKNVPRREAENEVLTAIVADAVGASVPVTIRTSVNDVVLESHSGDLGALLLGRANNRRSDNIYAKTVSGKRLGLLDVLVGNIGRHNFSWLLYESQVWGIDHTLSFNWDRQVSEGLVGAFGFQWTVRDSKTGKVKAYKGMLHPEDVPVLRRRLNRTRQEFIRMGREKDWHAMMAVFTKLAAAAKARSRLLGDD